MGEKSTHGSSLKVAQLSKKKKKLRLDNPASNTSLVAVRFNWLRVESKEQWCSGAWRSGYRLLFLCPHFFLKWKDERLIL